LTFDFRPEVLVAIQNAQAVVKGDLAAIQNAEAVKR